MDIEKTAAYLEQEEGYRPHIYRCTGGALTIGIGFNLGAGMPHDEAQLLLRYRLGKIQTALASKLPFFSGLSEPRQAALISMAYQLGVQGLLGFPRTLAYLVAGDFDAAGREMLDSTWARQTPARARRTAYMIRYDRWPEDP